MGHLHAALPSHALPSHALPSHALSQVRKRTAVPYNDTTKVADKERQRDERRTKRMAKSKMLKELREVSQEAGDAPEEVGGEGSGDEDLKEMRAEQERCVHV